MATNRVGKYALYGLGVGWLITWYISTKEAITPSTAFLAKTTAIDALVGLLAGDE